MQSRALEIIVGFFVCLGIAAIFVLTFRVAGLQSIEGGKGYQVTALFENIGGLKPGAAVTLAGVKIGRVKSIVIDSSTFEAKATLEISDKYNNIPADSGANILTAGLLGEKYIGIVPGGADQSLKQGSVIKITQSALVLENLIGQFMSTMATKEAKGQK
ncbi:MAG TPA: outer membrane lipid asymmetry maintenance protein MlaD [Stenotrophobium sp.]|jgi:phospholipid/cholesterol/gamma-HCH transport system substrate-binding protein|nr:outer membrane lipid asymmetry maintenance protein MlaD [Stenotrophobium sp.]